MRGKILIAEDDRNLRRVLRAMLVREGYDIAEAADGEAAASWLSGNRADALVSDIRMPKMDGLEVCKTLKGESKTALIPIIMLTAKSQESDKVIGLELGADDYVTKPFSPRELIARVKAVLRRAKDKDKFPEISEIGDLTIDFSKIQVSVKGKAVELTSKEFELLKILIKAKGRVLSRDYLLDTVWGFDHAIEIQSRTVDVHIRTLRKKLKNEAKRIITVKNYGYRFETEED